MKRLITAVALSFGWACVAWAVAPAPLTTLHAIHALTNAEASRALPVSFQATVTYFRGYEKTLFVQDGDVAIFVQATTDAKLVPGDRILIKGTTHESFRPNILSSDITLLHHGDLPKPIPASYDELIRAEHDCMLVSVHAKLRAADMVFSSDVKSIYLQMLTDGGTIDAVVDSTDSRVLEGLLDAELEVTGAASGRFDGKMEQTGVMLHVSSFADIKVLKRADTSPMALPVTPMDQVLTGYHVQVLSQRIRVRGAITYFQPGSAIVLQSGAKSLWIQTRTLSPMQVGDMADVTGFPGLHDGFLTLTNGEIQDSHVQAPITPVSATWAKLVTSSNVFDLVSIEGQVVSEIREAGQDEYVLVSGGQMFSAILRHPPPVTPGPAPATPMRQIPIGARIRVTGICMLDDSNPFNAQVPFTILMRSYDDMVIVAEPSWLNIRNLILIVGVLLLLVIAAGAWGWTLKSKVHRQTVAMAARIEQEAALERRNAQLEQQRSRILEDINGSRPLAEIIEQITALVSLRLHGAPCWCEIADGARLGEYPSDADRLRIGRELILARVGPPLGTLFAGFDLGSQPTTLQYEALIVGVRLATLAIETRRLYSDLLHRSEFDLLTDIQNRFSLDKRLNALIDKARQNAGIFGLIYIDLDHFKQVNDEYGHRIGDLYLQEVALRMKRQLRSHDTLARIGGDEFAALVPIVRSRAEVEEIALRLERCFDDPFAVDGFLLYGAASVGMALYPEDGATKDSLLSASDAAMYVIKHTKQLSETVSAEQRDCAPTPGHV
jgi:diguanylate cyclase (GGDEF)-like protein